MIIKEEKKLNYYSQYQFCELKRIYTADNFETMFDEGKCDIPPTKCPFNKETTDLHELLESFKFEFAKLSMDEQLEFIRTDAFLNAVWKCGFAEAIERYEADKRIFDKY